MNQQVQLPKRPGDVPRDLVLGLIGFPSNNVKLSSCPIEDRLEFVEVKIRFSRHC